MPKDVGAITRGQRGTRGGGIGEVFTMEMVASVAVRRARLPRLGGREVVAATARAPTGQDERLWEEMMHSATGGNVPAADLHYFFFEFLCELKQNRLERSS